MLISPKEIQDMSDNVSFNGQTEPAGRDGAILCLATGGTIADAARQADTCERTVYRWLTDASFRAEIAAARARLFDCALGRLAAKAASAVDTMVELSSNAAAASQPGASVRLNAARNTIEIGRRLWEAIEIENRLQSLEARLDEREKSQQNYSRSSHHGR
jgi:hypothetical protein